MDAAGAGRTLARGGSAHLSPDGLYFLGPIYDARWGLPTDTPRLPGCPERPRAFDGCNA
jgi:hypothetical protein